MYDSPGRITIAPEVLVAIATAVRRYKSEQNISLGRALDRLQLASQGPELLRSLQAARVDLMSITRAQEVDVCQSLDAGLEQLPLEGPVQAAITPLAIQPAALKPTAL